MLERIGGSCEATCVDKNRMRLSMLARQYVAGDHWLHNPDNRMPGNFSLLAIHAIRRRIDIDRSPLDIRGPFVRENPSLDVDENLLFEIRSRINDRTFLPDDIRLLRDIAVRRQQSFNTFLNRGKRYWDREAEKAKPFLDRMMNRDPTESQEKRAVFQQVYWLDQGSFILAKTALGRCDGPWFAMCPLGEKFQRFHIPIQPRL